MRRQRIAAVIAVLAVGAVPACSGGAERPVAAPPTSSSPTPTPTPTPTPAISEEQVAKAIGDYFATRNQAASKYDDALIKTVTSGPLLEQRLSDHKINRILKTKIPGIRIKNTVGTVTPPGVSPQRLVVETELQTERYPRLVAMAERKRASLPWSWRYAVNLGDETVMQFLTTKPRPGDSPLRTPTKAELARLKMSPIAAVQKVAALLTTKTMDLSFAPFHTSGTADSYFGEFMLAQSNGDDKPSTLASVDGPIVALQSSYDKVLVFATINIGWSYYAEPGTTVQWPPGPRAALAVKGRAYNTAVMYFEQLQVVIGLPPKGPGIPDVFGIEAQLTGVGGY
ncbi:hypothetical protein ACFVWG_00900 [Kribbella sp. NPDC058245]|uniref:hypothetical protein n=1 Tax=Kribbella sp. NPDC058245 TaxID=3346399 RepID=UPI0036EAC211